jgi:spermidine synthase
MEMDAARFVADPERTQTAQALCVDLYDHDAASPVLDSTEFYADCHRLLADGGAMTVNLFGRDASFERSAQRIAATFGAGQVLSLRPTREGNTIVVALKNTPMPERDTLAARADNIESRFKLPAKKWLRMMRPLASSADST